MPIAGAFAFESFPELLVTPRLRLRRPSIGDESSLAQTFFAGLGENAEPVSLEFARGFAEFVFEHWIRFRFGFLIVEIARDSGTMEPVGHAGLKYRDCGPPRVWGESSGAIELGYSLVPAMRGHGYATEAGRAVIAAAFETSSIPTILGRCGRDNVRSAATLVRCGMTENDIAGPWRVFEIHRLR